MDDQDWKSPDLRPGYEEESVNSGPYPGYNTLTKETIHAENMEEAIAKMRTFPNGTKFSIGGKWTNAKYGVTGNHAFKAEVFRYKDENWVVFRDFQKGGTPNLNPLRNSTSVYDDLVIFTHMNKFGENGFY